MTYHFNNLTDCRSTLPAKWNVAEHELAMWGEEMDFPAAPEIVAVIQPLINQRAFNETVVPEVWYEAVCGWWQQRHGFKLKRDWLLFSAGASAVLVNMVRSMTAPGEDVVMLTPAHRAVFDVLLENGRRIAECPLLYKGAEYHIDFTDLERKLAAPQTALMFLSNPQGPIGKVWDVHTLRRLGTLCEKYGVPVFVDETGCDLMDPGCEYVPFASVSDACAQNSATYISPEKTFHLSGLQTSALFVPQPALRRKLQRALHIGGADCPTTLGPSTSAAAFTQGAAWLDALRGYLLENKKQAQLFLAEELPQIIVVPSNVSHLLWLDCGRVSLNADLLADFIREKTGLCLSSGSDCGGNGGKFLSMNIACPRERLTDGLQRLQTAIPAYEDWSVSLC